MGAQKNVPQNRKNYVLSNEAGTKLNKNKGFWYFFVNHTDHSI